MKWLATDILRDTFKQDLLYIVKTFESESARGAHHREEESRNPELHRGNSREAAAASLPAVTENGDASI